jgi:hypothetical protein
VQGSARLASGGLAEEIGLLRAEPAEGDIAIGGAALAAAAAAGLVDEYRARVYQRGFRTALARRRDVSLGGVPILGLISASRSCAGLRIESNNHCAIACPLCTVYQDKSQVMATCAGVCPRLQLKQMITRGRFGDFLE